MSICISMLQDKTAVECSYSGLSDSAAKITGIIRPWTLIRRDWFSFCLSTCGDSGLGVGILLAEQGET